MSNYIDTDKLVLDRGSNNSQKTMWYHIKLLIDRTPAADVVPVKHGEWKPVDIGGGDYIYVCSVCKQKWTLNDGTPKRNNMHYCPNCGAKLEEAK